MKKVKKTTKINDLKARYEKACNEFIELFCSKQEMVFEFWVGGEIGECAVFGDLSFTFSDIVYDINTKQPKGLILKWYEDSVDYQLANPNKSNINYFSYSKGLRHKDLK